MYSYSSNSKRIGCVIIFILLILIFPSQKYSQMAYAEDDLQNQLNQNIDDILNDLDLSEFENQTEIVPNLNLNFIDFVKLILSGEYQVDYNSILSYIKSLLSDYIGSNLRFFVTLFIIVILYEIFKSFSSDKIKEINSSVKIIFSFLLATTILVFFKVFYNSVQSLISDLFSFANILFPILVTLLSLSGSSKSASVFSNFSVFLLETGMYILQYILLPLALALLLLSLFSSVFSKGKFSKLTDLFKMIFKYVIIIFFSVFGILSTVNAISSTTHDGINLKLTKFALKNYVPILGGYVSEGFDFIYSCSILIKNAIGVCSIIIIVFKIVTPLILVLFYSLCFKFLSVLTGLVGVGSFSDMFDDISKSFGNFTSVILASFLIIFIFIFLVIMSVGVV